MNEAQDEYVEKKPFDFRLFFRFMLIAFCVVCFGVYVGNIVFGKRSLDVMLSLQEQKTQLERDVETLKKQNAQLQKAYFELKELEPSGG
ncbi:septum formation initiator [uncultured Campylobacter sp.]|uniref:FtsB family cell division protein n=1 Tax=uncultured Campylobacter sp. TaxID=218934 RepID=UPI0025E8FF8C|nr:septum formation initiator [uncultured Campylobacter sp.]